MGAPAAMDVFEMAPRRLAVAIGETSVRLTHIAPSDVGSERLITASPDDGFVLVHHLRPTVAKDLWAEDKHVRLPSTPGSTSFFLDLAKTPTARLPLEFESVNVRTPRAAFDALSQELGASRVDSLRESRRWGTVDPIVDNLIRAALRLCESADECNSLAKDHLLRALLTHIAIVYGGMRIKQPLARGGLAPWQQRRATEHLNNNLGKGISLADLARQCELSVSHFSRAFKVTNGVSPLTWLQQRRVDAAQQLLRTTDLTLSAVALHCGFADQSHFSRVFRDVAGATPAQWRRFQRS